METFKRKESINHSQLQPLIFASVHFHFCTIYFWFIKTPLFYFQVWQSQSHRLVVFNLVKIKPRNLSSFALGTMDCLSVERAMLKVNQVIHQLNQEIKRQIDRTFSVKKLKTNPSILGAVDKTAHALKAWPVNLNTCQLVSLKLKP